MTSTIDTEFDVYSDTPSGKDPDSFSPTLRRYHRILWSKPLPSGKPFTLEDHRPGAYLCHKSELGHFNLSSDSIGHTYRFVRATSHIIPQLPEEELDDFYRLCSTIGGYIIFPSNRIDGKPTINGARGLSRKIGDRFDLTLESIRRHYNNEPSPLSEVLARYKNFFALFGDFQGYCSHFLLNDVVTEDGQGVVFFLDFRDFEGSPVPQCLKEYQKYRSALSAFVMARNQRIRTFCSEFTPA